MPAAGKQSQDRNQDDCADESHEDAGDVDAVSAGFQEDHASVSIHTYTHSIPEVGGPVISASARFFITKEPPQRAASATFVVRCSA